ncbi:hypothetical protein D6783_04945 [Candidatus Woesearchaeota archaeon]|nr:MAG: hypothetical protein D6783_04945 [Candidatus Woesearchaeota archaeon]
MERHYIRPYDAAKDGPKESNPSLLFYQDQCYIFCDRSEATNVIIYGGAEDIHAVALQGGAAAGAGASLNPNAVCIPVGLEQLLALRALEKNGDKMPPSVRQGIEKLLLEQAMREQRTGTEG